MLMFIIARSCSPNIEKSERLPQTTKDFDFPIEKGRYRSTSPPLKNSETTITGEDLGGGVRGTEQ